ncbi:MAG TPA: tetratricopeptide repeat protein [bacterium]|nr:tetratricopeptide repeat protein [bacterium]
MRREDTVRLDTDRLVREVRELGLRQWALARLVRVSRKTVSRWLTGKVRWITAHNLERLAEALGCRSEELTLPESAPPFATRADQRHAAELSLDRDLVQLLSPSGDWELAEGVLRAALEPNLPPERLGRLLNQLSITAWRQERYDEGRELARRAAEIGERIGDEAIRVKAAANMATADSLVGRHKDALEGYEWCLERAGHFEMPRDHAGVLTNVSMVYRDFARFAESVAAQREAVRLFTELELPFNLSIAYTCLGIILTEWGRLEEAALSLEESRRWAEAANFARKLVTLNFYSADVAALGGDPDGAGELIAEGLRRLGEFEHYDPACLEITARCRRLAGDYDGAERSLAEGLERSRTLLPARALILQERARLALALGDAAGEERYRGEANDIFEKTDLEKRIRRGPVAEYGRMFTA